MLITMPKSLRKNYSQQFTYQILQADINLGHQMQERIAKLEQALKFESMLHRISQKVLVSLDENYILQTAINELALELETACCATLLLNPKPHIFTSHSLAMPITPVCEAEIISQSSNPEIDQQLRQGKYVQFCPNTSSNQGRYTLFASPIVNNNEIFGTLWVIWDISKILEDSDIYVVQQVANQCAIAIHQSRLYQAAQKQVEELKRLNEVKDDFLNTVTHDLRSPLSNMRLAADMLNHQLTEGRRVCGHISQQNSACSKTLTHLKILQAECERGITLINDLLDLQRLETEKEPLNTDAIDLEDWLHYIIQPFEKRIEERQLALKLDFAPNLPTLLSNSAHLQRVFSELLHNACKYTPPHETISLTVLAELEQVQICVSNSGVEIPSKELPRIFEKFYRVPSSDRWKQGGTGLGLALVKNVVEHLNGSIEVESKDGQTSFTVKLPISPVI
ncbi:GAF domain-containing sensor histidine kinase [Nostoc sp. FACHB-973]|nr:GAF domain-containing sensor histidine kinase [Nostoc sp. FACHB-973]